ncbi:NAD(P)-dependent oxidoreductase [Streptomyces sp. NPDC091204]|uniref:NAD-dependent epimerase/dehydratase family protein n=1 Tax=Streptomyces sp. NPDC091204 TaxID=3155299 RepID=UPI00343BAA18
MGRILVTGSRGLIGSALARALTRAGHEPVSYDTAGDRRQDVTDPRALSEAVTGCSGIVHLAGVSRVVWGERDPARCRRVNVTGTRNVLTAAAGATGTPPWVLFGSSREVYGQAARLPVLESARHAPLNCYARSKAEAESLVGAARESGLNASVVRFSSVYGSTADHADRVAPAFARLASRGTTLRVDGTDTTLDFTHLDDVVGALLRMTEILSAGDRLPTLHLVSGDGTRLTELAHLAVATAGGGRVTMGRPRTYDVERFVGDPDRAERVLGWRARVGIEEGMRRLVEAFATPGGSGAGESR